MAKRVVRWQMTLDKPEDVTVRGWRDLLKAAWLAVGTWWDREIKRRHFEPYASSKYKHQFRTPLTRNRKRKLAARRQVEEGGTRDLVWSGATRRAVMQAHIPRAFPTRMTIDMPTPSYIQMRPRKANRPNMGEELTTIAPDELNAAERLWIDTFERGLTAYRERTVITG
jgi:hypothetical protein